MHFSDDSVKNGVFGLRNRDTVSTHKGALPPLILYKNSNVEICDFHWSGPHCVRC